MFDSFASLPEDVVTSDEVTEIIGEESAFMEPVEAVTSSVIVSSDIVFNLILVCKLEMGDVLLELNSDKFKVSTVVPINVFGDEYEPASEDVVESFSVVVSSVNEAVVTVLAVE